MLIHQAAQQIVLQTGHSHVPVTEMLSAAAAALTTRSAAPGNS